MGRFRSAVVASLVSGAGLLLCGPALRVSAQAPSQAPAPVVPTKSVYGKLLSVDKTLGNVLMTEDGGAQLAWHFDPAVVAEAARFKPGDPLIVIYRQVTPKEKRVTAIAFPGTAKSPIYVNMSGDRVVIRSSGGVSGSCNQTSGNVSESVIPSGGLAEVMDECWCCAPVGETCTPGNKSGLGRALLVQCFK
jgi:hypothetical protein